MDKSKSYNRDLKNLYEEILNRSFEKLLKNDYDLLLDNIHEVTITSLLSKYISEHIHESELSVDVEYNRMILSEEEEKHLSKAIFVARISDRPDLSKMIKQRIRPDIIVHQRGTNTNNILWLELKIGGNPHKCDLDREKTIYATSQLHYKLGICILVDPKHQSIIFQWVNADEIEYVWYTINDMRLEEKKRDTIKHTL